jgi:uncharacterized membrane protein YkoI
MSDKTKASSAIMVLFIILSMPAVCMSEGRPVVCDRLYQVGNEKNSAYNSTGAVDLKTTAFYETEDAFSISLSSSKYSYKSGEEIIVNAKVNNNMNKQALLVRCLDGSVRSWRYPQCAFEIKDSSGKTPENIFVPMCKVVNPLTTDDFIKVPPGESAELFDGGFVFSNAFKLVKPGKYYVFIRYSTVTLKEWQWYGLYSDEYWNSRNSNEFWKKREKEIIKNRDLLNRIELVSIKSNTIEIEITGKPISREEAIKIAGEACRKAGWKFNDITADEDDGKWVVRTNTKALGMNVAIVIDKFTGAVIEKHITGP